MLGPGRYLLGVAELALLVGFAWLGAARLRRRLLPEFRGAPACLAAGVIGLALLIWVAVLLGTVSLLEPLPYLVGVAAVGLGLRLAIREPPTAPPARGAAGEPPIGAWGWPAIGVAVVVAAIAILHFGGRREDPAGDRHDRVRQHLVPRPLRGRLLPERRHLEPALHRAAVPRLVLPRRTGKSSTRSGCWHSGATCSPRC